MFASAASDNEGRGWKANQKIFESQFPGERVGFGGGSGCLKILCCDCVMYSIGQSETVREQGGQEG